MCQSCRKLDLRFLLNKSETFLVSVTYLFARFAIVQNKFQKTNKTKINCINDNHIKWQVSLHFWGVWPTVWHPIAVIFGYPLKSDNPLVHLCMLTAASRRIEACCSLVQADDGGYVRQLVRQTLSKRGEIVMMPKMARICGNFTKRPPGWSPRRCDLQWVSNLF